MVLPQFDVKAVCDECASIVNRPFYAVRGICVVFSDVGPDVENIGFGKGVRS